MEKKNVNSKCIIINPGKLPAVQCPVWLLCKVPLHSPSPQLWALRQMTWIPLQCSKISVIRSSLGRAMYWYHQSMHKMKDKEIYLGGKKFFISGCIFFLLRSGTIGFWRRKIVCKWLHECFRPPLHPSAHPSARCVSAVLGGPSWLLPQSPLSSPLVMLGSVDSSFAMPSMVSAPYVMRSSSALTKSCSVQEVTASSRHSSISSAGSCVCSSDGLPKPHFAKQLAIVVCKTRFQLIVMKWIAFRIVMLSSRSFCSSFARRWCSTSRGSWSDTLCLGWFPRPAVAGGSSYSGARRWAYCFGGWHLSVGYHTDPQLSRFFCFGWRFFGRGMSRTLNKADVVEAF